MYTSSLLILVKKVLERILKSDPVIEREMLGVSKERRENHAEKMCSAIIRSPKHMEMLRESCIRLHPNPLAPIEFVKKNIAAYL